MKLDEFIKIKKKLKKKKRYPTKYNLLIEIKCIS